MQAEAERLIRRIQRQKVLNWLSVKKELRELFSAASLGTDRPHHLSNG